MYFQKKNILFFGIGIYKLSRPGFFLYLWDIIQNFRRHGVYRVYYNENLITTGNLCNKYLLYGHQSSTCNRQKKSTMMTGLNIQRSPQALVYAAG
jgi:hypothetical protein